MIQSIHSTLAYAVLAVLVIAVINAFLGLEIKSLPADFIEKWQVYFPGRLCAGGRG